MTRSRPTVNALPRFFTTEEVAQMAHLSPDTLRKAAAAGRVKALKRGRRWLFTHEQAMAVITPGQPARKPKAAPERAAERWGLSPKARRAS